MSWANEVEDGQREAISDFGTTFQWKGKTFACTQGTNAFFDQAISGGYLENDLFMLIVLVSDCVSATGVKQPFDTSDEVKMNGKSFKIKQIGFDDVDPGVELTIEGESQ